MFREDNGNLSMMRLLPFLVVCSMMAAYLWVAFRTVTMPSLDLNSIILVIGLTAGKVVQKTLEQKADGCNAIGAPQ